MHPEWTPANLNQITDIGALCESCARFCHANKGHDIVALGVKDDFACDCGNQLFLRIDQLIALNQRETASDEMPSHTCQLYPSKPPFNPRNQYNHNWREQYCYCNGGEVLPMVQCVGCCDWFHNACAEAKYRETHNGATIDLNDESIDFVCSACENKQRNTPTPSVPSIPTATFSTATKQETSQHMVDEEEEGEVKEDEQEEASFLRRIRVGVR